ncbi:MAG TPA: biopolymer transporter ExbD [Nitrospinaceae bacterium]|jgi:biopolymer transport protein ExbD|nr:biopolymer transporter ExbD [Nitrospinaceae bacterium]MDP7108681.1 biopolymer transporter ExbD [Nitrospinaceae bacterium]HJL73156.1 biopolymer transporter ExbD [Nitrospinaceae bacterium]HJO00926.1 biopolymer transporter ExbD [Nitrospinaceae bacterium]
MILMKPRRKISKLDMAPLIDVVFLLLIFFMLTFAIQGQGMDISLPEGQSADAQTEESLIVKINNDEKIKINNELVSIESFQETIEQKLNGRIDKTVVIEAQQTTRYELFARILDLSRLAGAEGFSIVK